MAITTLQKIKDNKKLEHLVIGETALTEIMKDTNLIHYSLLADGYYIRAYTKDLGEIPIIRVATSGIDQYYRFESEYLKAVIKEFVKCFDIKAISTYGDYNWDDGYVNYGKNMQKVLDKHDSDKFSIHFFGSEKRAVEFEKNMFMLKEDLAAQMDTGVSASNVAQLSDLQDIFFVDFTNRKPTWIRDIHERSEQLGSYRKIDISKYSKMTNNNSVFVVNSKDGSYKQGSILTNTEKIFSDMNLEDNYDTDFHVIFCKKSFSTKVKKVLDSNKYPTKLKRSTSIAYLRKELGYKATLEIEKRKIVRIP